MENDISALISRIIQNPEFAEMVKELRGTDENVSDVQKDMMEKLPGVLETVSPLLGGTNSSEKSEKEENPKPERADEHGEGEEKSKAAFKSVQKYDKGKAEKLMCALKPYLNPERCLIIDRCLSVMQLTDVVGALGGIDGILGK
ncbi:MAG: hypothetical protein ACI4XJ_08300 [Eubacteriales bacterium]